MSTIGSNYYTDNYLEDIHISEKDKNTDWYLKDNIDYWIANLVREKAWIKTFRNYYSGVRDKAEFQHLTDNFGIGSPSSLNFTPLIKPRIDALLSQVESETFTYMATCIDDKTIDIIAEEKKSKKIAEIEGAVQAYSKAAVKAFKSNPEDTGQPPSELSTTLDKISSKYGTNYLSDFEIAAQDVLKYFETETHLDLKQKLKQLALDVLITGECHFRVVVDRVGADPKLIIIKPENMFYNKNTNSQYYDTSDASVHREYKTRKEVLHEYGKYMSKEQKEYIYGDRARVRTARSLRSGMDLELYYGDEDTYQGQKSYSMLDTLEVYHVEWKALNKVKLTDEDKKDEEQVEGGYQSDVQTYGYRMDRYEGVRISGSVYVNCGKSSHVPRSESRPYDCQLSYNGIVYNDRGGKPFSLVGAMKDLQDVYDLTLFYRDNLIANSGVPGSRINIAGIPRQLGNEFMERLMKFIALKKNGFELIDPTEPGSQLFNHYGEFDGSVNGQSLQGINVVLQTMERQADLIAGTNQQMLGQIAERDAVGNVKTGIQQSLMINQDLFELIRTNQKRLLIDMLNNAKIAYKKGKKASYIAGSESYVFSIAPDKFCYSDYAISISYSSKDVAKITELKTIAKEYAKSGLISPDVLTKAIMSDSVTEINRIIAEAWAISKLENDELKQAKQQVEEFDKQMKQMQQELATAQQQVKSFESMNLQLKERELTMKEKESNARLTIDAKAQEATEEFQEDQTTLKGQVVQLEREQLYLDTGNAREPKNNI